jgi:hypothetical protein
MPTSSSLVADLAFLPLQRRGRDQISRSVVVCYDVVFRICTEEVVPKFGVQKTKCRPIIVDGTEKVIVSSTEGMSIRNSLRLGRALSHAVLHIFPQLQGLLHRKNAPPSSGALTILTLQMFTRDTSLPNYWGNSILQ